MKFLTQRGFSFGLTSGLITTLGLMVGLFSSTQSKIAVMGGIITIAIADAFSDSLGMHISEEAQGNKTPKQIWRSTIFTFISKFIFAIIFIFPFFFAQLNLAVIINIIIASLIIILYNFHVAKNEGKKPFNVIFEHLIIAIVVILTTYYVGQLIGFYFV